MFFVNWLGYVMHFCYNLLGNYGLAIILFTILSKFVLLPLSIMIQKESIKMVKMQPKINRIKINYFGDNNTIAEETSKLYKEEKYNALSSLFPLVVQIILLLGLVSVINHPLTHLTKISDKSVNSATKIVLNNHKNLNKEASDLEIEIVKDIQKGKTKSYEEVLTKKEVKEVKDLKLSFLGFNLSWVASVEKGIAYLVPIIAGLSALFLCVFQNKINVLQAEQSKYNKYGMLILSVGLSLYLGTFVAAGVALYWTISNLLAVLQQFLLNIFINPKKHVDYEALEETRKELKELNDLNKDMGKRTPEQIKKEKEDYKKFFKIVNKKLVFYSESNGFYKYYKGIIEYILNNTNITIHYITSDYNDNIFKMEKENDHIKAYYIEEKKLITLMMKMDADVVVMTMPDLQNFHIKRSYVRKDIEYIYIPHGMDSLNMTMREASMNHYDTVYVTGKHQKEEAERTNDIYHLTDRKIFNWGYSLLDDMISDYEKNKKKASKEKNILIAPSWQKDNIIDLCLEDILNNVKDEDYNIIVRPHPQQVRHMKERFEQLKEEYKKYPNIIIQTDFSSNSTVFDADVMITDWSGIAYEYAFTTKKPVIFINTPMKIMNPNYQNLGIEPFNIWARDCLGKSLDGDEINNINKVIKDMLKNNKKYYNDIDKFTKEYTYNLGTSSKKGAEYIIDVIKEKIEERKNNK
ncbi:MAG: membrane protein insertase YidC [Bacilli bacterium]|nr:membrane protein insertase YidC [Bacilli bacterium]